MTAGIDSQKNHSLGIFRGTNDTFPFRNTHKYDLQEAYVSFLLPLGDGLIVKGGKFVTLLGYEVIESPNNLNFSRGYLFALAIPLTHTGGLLSYTFGEQFSVTAGVVLGWDNSRDNNDAVSYTGQFAFTPVKDLTANLNWIVGPEQTDNKANQRAVVNYTGIKNTTLGLNVDYGFEQDEAFLRSLGTRQNNDATWWGIAGYGAYDFTEWFRLALRQEFFRDADGARTGFGTSSISSPPRSPRSSRSGRAWWRGRSTGTTRRRRRSSRSRPHGRTPRRASPRSRRPSTRSRSASTTRSSSLALCSGAGPCRGNCPAPEQTLCLAPC